MKGPRVYIVPWALSKDK